MSTFSQWIYLVKALIHQPDILLLDEPTNGLDPAGIHEIRELLSDLATNHGVTIFISSHILGEISRFATRIGIIHEGKLLQEFDADQLDKRCQKRLLVNTTDVPAARALLLEQGYSVGEGKNGVLELTDERAIQKPDAIATLLVNGGCPPTLLQVDEEDLESYFLRTIGMEGGMK